MVIQLTASRACFTMCYLEVAHDDTAVGRKLGRVNILSHKGYFLDLIRERCLVVYMLVHLCMAGYGPKDSPRALNLSSSFSCIYIPD